MKNKVIYFLPAILFVICGCLSSKNSTPVPSNPPIGTFAGHFEIIHHRQGGIDSASANIILDMQAATGFKVTGDTSSVHEGSYGGFEVYEAYGQVYFQDHDNYKATGAPAKVHLNGLYNYSYDGTTFQIVYQSYLDTLRLKYYLKKTN